VTRQFAPLLLGILEIREEGIEWSSAANKRVFSSAGYRYVQEIPLLLDEKLPIRAFRQAIKHRAEWQKSGITSDDGDGLIFQPLGAVHRAQ
jgi:hypothetical protein